MNPTTGMLTRPRTPASGASSATQTAADLRLVIGRLARRLRSQAPSGLTPSQLSALVTVEELGPLRLRDLAGREGVTPPTVSRVVDVLEQRELLSRTQDASDARATMVEATADGRALLTELRSTKTAMLADRLGRLDPKELERLSAALPILHRIVTDLTTEAPTG